MEKRKRNITLDVDSALAFMQEIYNELAQQRETALIIQKKMMSFMKDVEDVTIIGPIIKDQQKILNDNIEKKLTLSKLQTALLQKENDGKPHQKLTMSATEREMLEQLIENNDEKST